MALTEVEGTSRVRAAWAWLNRWFPWLALVGVVVGLTLAVRGQWEAITELEWAGAWPILVASAGLFAAAPLAQASTSWIILRLLGAPAPFGETMRIWADSYVLRYAPSGALAVVYRVRERERVHATREQILVSEAYENLGPATGLGFLALLNGLSDDPSPGLRWAVATYAVAYLIGFIVPFLPGGLGAREGTLVAVLAPRYDFGAATGIALATRLAVTLGEAIAVCLIWSGYYARRILPPRPSRSPSTDSPP